MKLSEMGVKRKCFNCSDLIGQGGHWLGAYEITVCTENQCVESLIHIAIDSLLDGHLSDVHPKTQRKDITELVSSVMRQKLRY